jgi:hypothetical protein
MQWTTGEIVGAIALLAVPVFYLVSGLRRAWRDVASSRRIRRQEREREDRRRPGPETVVVEGHIVTSAHAEPIRIVTRRQHGCLGGPIVHDIPVFELELDDGTRWHVAVGDDPVVENLELLRRGVASQPVAGPPHTGQPESILPLRGRVRIAGMLRGEDGRLAPPAEHSAVVTFVEP